MESFVVPSLPVGAMPRGTRRGSLKPPCPWDPGSLPGEAGARGLHPGRGAHSAPAGQTCLGGQGKGAPRGKGCFLGTGGVLPSQPASALLSFSPHVFPAGIPKAVGAASSSASSPPPALPPCLCSSVWDSPTWPQAAASPGSELPARTIYRPWFSPYSYFTCTAAASQQHLSSGLAIGAQEPEEADNLSETICSSSCSSEEPQPSQQGQQTTSRHSSQEGYSCKAYYRKLKVLLEKEHQAQEAEAPPGTRAAPAAAGGHCSIAAAASAINATRSRACCSPGRHGSAAAPR
nr:spermatogenesis-associated protein 46 isoform X1 [Anser cygnoides]